MFAAVLGEPRGERDDTPLLVDPFPFERNDLAAALPREDKQFNHLAVRADFSARLCENRPQFLVGQEA